MRDRNSKTPTPVNVEREKNRRWFTVYRWNNYPVGSRVISHAKYPKPCKDTIRRTFQTLLPNSNWSVCCWTNTILGRESIDFYVFLCKSSEHICVWNPDSIRGSIFRLKCPKGRSFYRVSFETSQQWPLLINLQLIHRPTKTKPAKLSHLSAGTWNNKRHGPFMWTMERIGAIVYQNIMRGVQYRGNSCNNINSK